MTVKKATNRTTQVTPPQATPRFDSSYVKLCERYTLQLARTRGVH